MRDDADGGIWGVGVAGWFVVVVVVVVVVFVYVWFSFPYHLWFV